MQAADRAKGTLPVFGAGGTYQNSVRLHQVLDSRTLGKELRHRYNSVVLVEVGIRLAFMYFTKYRLQFLARADRHGAFFYKDSMEVRQVFAALRNLSHN